MRWLAVSLASAAMATAVPVAAQTYGYGYGQSGYGSDFDYRRCYSGEREDACRERLRRESQRYDGSRYGSSYGYGQSGYDNRYGYGQSGYDNRYGYGQSGYGYDRYNRQGYYGNNTYGGGYYGNGYGYSGGSYGGYGYGYNGGSYGGGYGRNDGTGLALTILGIALGAQILGSLDDRDYWDRHRHDDDYRNWCRRQYSSFDWNSGTYAYGDGTRRYCRRG
ncbi:MAG: hypothetical protein J0L52_10345 [Caulobacterales bacterium]|nr:hypothetical protein [Caulobacterales bacterium]